MQPESKTEAQKHTLDVYFPIHNFSLSLFLRLLVLCYLFLTSKNFSLWTVIHFFIFTLVRLLTLRNCTPHTSDPTKAREREREREKENGKHDDERRFECV